ncbi:MAG: transposase [Clostridia bacterium]|nr:transposase [Clostridia bacterium]
MRMKEDYMRNGQIKAGYNVQIAVESEYIVGVGLFPNPTDTTTLIPFLERMRRQTGRKIADLTADAGYPSEENFDYLEKNGQRGFIKPQNYEISKTRKYKSNKFRPEHMNYDSEADEYICPNGKKLKYIYTSKYTTENGYKTNRKVYQCESCEGCPYRNKCHKSE